MTFIERRRKRLTGRPFGDKIRGVRLILSRGYKMKRLFLASTLLALMCSASLGHAQFSTLYTFPGQPDGAHPVGTPFISSTGVLFGLTNSGGVSCSSDTLGCSVAFSLSPPSQSGGAWTEAVLYSFQGGADGASANSNLIPGDNGALMGTTAAGGGPNVHCRSGCGTFFQLTPPAEQGGSWTESVLFDYPREYYRPGTLLAAGSGTLYGASTLGGNTACVLGCGAIYELVPPQTGGAWTLASVHQFSPKTGAYPLAPLIQDANGVLYGMTEEGGDESHAFCPTGCGAVFSLTPPAIPGGAWTYADIYRFRGGKDGFIPVGSLAMGADGTLYGATQLGGAQGCGTTLGCGTVFSLTPPTAGGLWTKTTLYAFAGGTDAASPQSGVVIGSGGVLYGATPEGGGTGCSGIGCGVLYELTPPAVSGGSWTETILHAFTGGSDGQALYTPPAIDAGGVLYGISLGGAGTACGGVGCGVVYQYIP